ncbi:MAG: peptidoglycan D,D-transpeptidase FtsI family protein [Burkholderiales bacterium]
MSVVLSKPGKAAGAGGAAHASMVRSVNYSNSPLLASKTPTWRSKFLFALIGLSFGILIAKAVHIQIIAAPFYLSQAEKRLVRTVALKASRGRITDRNGVLLAVSVPAPSLWAIPKEIEADALQQRQLARLLGISPIDLANRLDDNPNFVWLRRSVDDEVAEKILALGIKGIYQMREYKRQYPEGEPISHVVGFTNIEDVGQEGIELAYQSQLEGHDGKRRVIKDRLGQVVEDAGEAVAPMEGQDLALSIDSKVQFFAYQRLRDAVIEHKAQAGSVVVLDSLTGEVLALANYPSYSPSDRRNLTGAQLRNRALTDTFEPGSTMKPFVVALALETGRVKPDTVIATAPGRINITGSTISDAHPHGDLTVEQVIQKSSNVGTVKMAMQMHPREMHELFTGVGFGQKPPLQFPGVVTGRLRPFKTWRPIEQATMSYGYGLSASLFQLARAYTVFANDGELAPVSILKNTGPAKGIRVFSSETAQAMRHMLQMAATQGGTAPRAQTVGFSVGGKTGTARKQEGQGYADKKYRAWFVGMAPIHHPRIVVAVMVDEPRAGRFYGGDVAAPVFSQVVQQTLRTLNVAPDLEVKPEIVTSDMTAIEESF